jgi:hypothetical protein
MLIRSLARLEECDSLAAILTTGAETSTWRIFLTATGIGVIADLPVGQNVSRPIATVIPLGQPQTLSFGMNVSQAGSVRMKAHRSLLLHPN